MMLSRTVYHIREGKEKIKFRKKSENQRLAIRSVWRYHAYKGEWTMPTVQFQVKTSSHTQMVDITSQVRKAVEDSGVKEGICVVFVPHTTAAVTVNENADPDVQTDFMKEINKIVPWEDGYRHFEGNSAAHLKASVMGFSETLIIERGQLLLGTWQGIYFLEYDGPRNRRVCVKVMEG